MTDVTYEDVEYEVRRLAAERPDHVYESPYNHSNAEEDELELGSCRYQHGEGIPGCLFGHAFLNLGLHLTDEDEGKAAYEVLERMRIGLTDDQALWVGDVQAKQDSGFTWANAVRAADEAAMRAYVSRLWADDWDSDEDSVYDNYK